MGRIRYSGIAAPLSDCGQNPSRETPHVPERAPAVNRDFSARQDRRMVSSARIGVCALRNVVRLLISAW